MGSQASLDMGASPGSRTYDEEGERALREKHAQLCTEKCRLLSKLEASTAEVRAVQNEVQYVPIPGIPPWPTRYAFRCLMFRCPPFANTLCLTSVADFWTL